MSLPALATAAGQAGLALHGALHEGEETLALLGPDGARWEAVFAAAPEAADRRPDPIDRWSRRIVGALAESFAGRAVFPFDGPPWPPVFRWAAASGACHPSPVGMLVHARAGLWVSFRGVVALPGLLPLPQPEPSPCGTCAGRPCLTACPVGAFTGGAYDVPSCIGHLAGAGRLTCLATGCAVRHACPAGAALTPAAAQAARHMTAFLTAHAVRKTETG
jgi:hypothetical protein